MITQTRPVARSLRDNRSLTLVTALVDHGLVPAGRRDEAIDVIDRTLAGQAIAVGPMKRRFAELAGYVGGAFVVAAAAVFLSDQWNHMTTGAQVGLLVGIAVVLAGAGVALALTGGGFGALRAGHQPVRRRLGGVLLTAAAGSAGSALALLVEEPSSFSSVPALAGFATFAVLSVLGYLLAPSVVGQAGAAFGAVMTATLAWDSTQATQEIGVAITVLALGLGWLALTEARFWLETTTGRVIGSLLALFGAQFPLFGSDHEAWGYGLTALLAVAGFGAYLSRAAWPYLAVGVAAITLAAPEALMDWTDGAVGPAGVLLVAGLALLGASVLGFRLRQEVADAA